MTTANWERMPGETVEEFIAAMILLDAGAGNHRRPARGDAGVDVYVPSEAGLIVYQVKRYSSALTSGQKSEIRRSWRTFLDETAGTTKVAGWHLVMPLDPTSADDAFVAGLKSAADLTFAVDWIGRARVDGWTSNHPALYDYYFGDGARRLEELVSQALNAGAKFNEELDPTDLLSSIESRITSVTGLLAEVDPFYSYAHELRLGDLARIPKDETVRQSQQPGLVLTVQRQISANQYLSLHIFAKSPVSPSLRPIRQHIEVLAEAEEDQRSLERLIKYGAPIAGARVRVVSSDGPPGVPMLGNGELSTAGIQPATPLLPPMELRVLRDGELLAAERVTEVLSSSGTEGWWLRAEVGPTASMEFVFHSKKPEEQSPEVKFNFDIDAGAAPADVLPVLTLFTQLVGGDRAEFGAHGGKSVIGWHVTVPEIQRNLRPLVRVLRALQTVQQHTVARVGFPSQLTAEGAESIIRSASLLEGTTIQVDFGHDRRVEDIVLDEMLSPRGEVRLEELLVVEIGGTLVTTDVRVEHVYSGVWSEKIDGEHRMLTDQHSTYIARRLPIPGGRS